MSGDRVRVKLSLTAGSGLTGFRTEHIYYLPINIDKCMLIVNGDLMVALRGRDQRGVNAGGALMTTSVCHTQRPIFP